MMKTLVTTLWLATALAAALPAPSVSPGPDLGSRPTVISHHEETPRK
jgi:hypothetical protein